MHSSYTTDYLFDLYIQCALVYNYFTIYNCFNILFAHAKTLTDLLGVMVTLADLVSCLSLLWTIHSIF